MQFINKQLNIKVYLPIDEVEDTDYLNIYRKMPEEIVFTKIKTRLKGQLSYVDPANPSSTSTEYISYLYNYIDIATQPGFYYYNYTLCDQLGNEGIPIVIDSIEVCLTPEKPNKLTEPVYTDGILSFKFRVF